MTQTLVFPMVLAAAACALVACTLTEDMPQPHEGAKLFADNCTACHGYRADEQAVLPGGEIAPNLSQIQARNDGVFPRAEVLSQIDGFSRGAHAGQVMPAFGEALTGPLVPVEVDGTFTPTPRPLAALLVYLESIQD